MEAKPREVQIFELANGRSPFNDWLLQLTDQVQGKVMVRIERVEDGNFGDCEPVGSGVHELRIDFGPGFRVYFGEDGDLVVILCGGTKRTQARDIKIAKDLWSDYNA